MQIREAQFPQDTQALTALIQEYVAWLDIDLSQRGFDREMAHFEQTFTLPSGLFLIAQSEQAFAGCVGLLRRTPTQAEVKRLYVKPAFRGMHLGEQLMTQLLQKARELKLEQLMLDSVPQTAFARHLYKALGFQEISPYYANPLTGTAFFALDL